MEKNSKKNQQTKKQSKDKLNVDPGDRRNISKTFRWDELNILETFHPPGKTYGHIKCDEPDTPYHYKDEENKFDPNLLAAKLVEGSTKDPKFKQKVSC